MRFESMLVTTLVCAAIAAPRNARAEDPPDQYGYSWHDSRMRSDYGVSTTLGGGIGSFTGQEMRDAVASPVGGLWDLRVTIGSHTPLGLEVGYLGTATSIDALTGSQSGTLVGTTAEGALRYNVLPHYAFNPYAFAGVGWQRYDMTGGTFTLSDTGMNATDNELAIPMGVGLSYRADNGLIIDARGTFRAAIGPDLVLTTVGGTDYAPMHTWAATAAAGYEF